MTFRDLDEYHGKVWYFNTTVSSFKGNDICLTSGFSDLIFLLSILKVSIFFYLGILEILYR